MKNQLLKVCAIALWAMSSTSLFAQKNVDISFTDSKPTIDGQVDALWESIPKQEIATAYASEAVSYTASATWQAIWDNEQIYLLVTVPDDDFYPGNEADKVSWLADKVELFFDVNENIIDGGGPARGDGHYQIAPSMYNAPEDDFIGHEFSFTVSIDSTSYICEYAIAIDSLIDKTNQTFNPYSRNTIGFDVTLIDLDEFGKGESTSRERVNWHSDASLGESWSNMDNAGHITFSNSLSCEGFDTTFLSETHCFGDSIIFEGSTLIKSGTYEYTYFTAQGCDSVVSLDLTINEVSTRVEQDGLILTASEDDATYQWVTYGDTKEAIEGATEQSYTATENGDYAVIITKSDCAQTSNCINITGVGIHDILTNGAISLYPNPVNNVLNISIKAAVNTATVKIYNTTGQLVIVETELSTDNISINTEELTHGVYLVHIVIDNNSYNYHIVK